MRRNKLVFATITTIASCALTSACLANMTSAPYGWYAEGNVGSTKLLHKQYPGSASTSGIGGNVNIGYKFMPYLATEMGYTRYANTSIKDNNDTRAATDKHFSYDFAFKGIVPIVDSGLEAFAKLGVQRAVSRINIDDDAAASNVGIASSKHSATGVYLASGVQFYFMPELAANVQWARAKGNARTGTMDLLSAGFSFIFD